VLASIDLGYRPATSAQLFPCIVNRLANLWGQPVQMQRSFEELLIDHRGNRKGFPLNMLMDLSTLKRYYQHRVFSSKQQDVRCGEQGHTPKKTPHKQ
jgi:hypothetical protein